MKIKTTEKNNINDNFKYKNIKYVLIRYFK